MMYTILLGIIGLDIVVLVHELGHLLAAKLSGIEVEAFSIGMGKKIASFKYKGTEYRLSMLPVGGYCKMKGEEQFSKALKDKSEMIPFEEGSLFSVSPLKRIATYFAGPFANFLFSVLVLSLIWFSGFQVQTYSNKIVLLSDYAEVFHSTDNPADIAGMKTGDIIIRINDQEIANYADIQEIIYRSPNKPLVTTVFRGNEEKTLSITPVLDKDTGTGRIGVSPFIEPVVKNVKPDSAAYIAGLKPTDRIISVNGRDVQNYLDILSVLAFQPKIVKMVILTESLKEERTLIPVYNDNGLADLGITFDSKIYTQGQLGPLKSIFKGTEETFKNLILTVKSLGLLFSGVNLNKAVSGPIRITYFVGEVATESFKEGFKSGITNIFRFLSIISIALCFANLLPIPIFDGGLILFTIITLVKKTPIKPAVYYRYQSVGLFILLIIFFLTTFNDISFLFSKG